ncbi:hypothetical protein JGH11_14315 [Dysgonomonas sp. Marseille-P4677]|uniref:hypothetical protein n=1 Tax=Dysgonomonas sp. Marseille-P4677 TaxID=2364790 RepID=UPI001914533D|nr:hypothetical protein [Dysgonomonas sp. Marseille-P4677]MBK5722050.1 hypothetical protein [Dysgonomonas sp. Marseille-P4677]
MKYSLLLILLLMGVMNIVTAQTYSSIISDKEIYDFMEWMVDNDKKSEKEIFGKNRDLLVKTAPWDTANFISENKALDIQYFEQDNKYLFKRSEGLDTLFTDADKKFLLDQYNSIQSSVWTKNIGGKKIQKRELKENDEINMYSIPLFTKDKEFVIIYKIFYCGYECAYGKYYLYKLIGDNKWKFVLTLNPWST